jgi:KTSC domain
MGMTMATPPMRKVLSSHVQQIGWDEASGELWVQWAPSVRNPEGPVSVYADVSADEWDAISGAPSIGQALHLMIRRIKAHRNL